MTAVTQPSIPTEVGLTDTLNLLKKEIFLSFNAHHIGSIVSFDIASQTATASINYTKTFYQAAENGLYRAFPVEYPNLTDAPVIVLGGGAGALTFPIQEGDECLVLFNDRDLSNWLQDGAGGPLATSRLHSFSDGIILVGIRSLLNSLADYDSARVALRGGPGVIGVNPTSTPPGKLLLTNASPTGSGGSYTYATTLGTMLASLTSQLGSLVTAIAAITVTGVTSGGSVSGVPANAAAITAIGTQISATAAQIAGLLE